MTTEETMLALDFPAADSQFGVTRATLRVLARRLNLSESDVVNLALARLVRDPPAYLPDDGPVSAEVLNALREDSGAALPLASVIARKTLF